MADGVRLGSAVTFVQDLDRSMSFYTEVLGLEEADRSTTAALLISASGAQLILRAMGPDAAHPLGGVGVQYVVWTAPARPTSTGPNARSRAIPPTSRPAAAPGSRWWRGATPTTSRC